MLNSTQFTRPPILSSELSPSQEAVRRKLKQARIALPGLGGVGSAHLVTLASMGAGTFHLADLDCYETSNIQRQLGASMATLNRPKVEVMAEQARRLNPDVHVRRFPQGIHAGNIDRFLKDIDIVVDGIEFFAIDVRRMLYQACLQHRIPVVHAGPIGYGAALYVFLPDGPSFDQHFGMEDDMTRAEQLIAHLMGHSAAMINDINPRHLDIAHHKGPALGSACILCASVAATEVVKILNGIETKAAAPNGVYFDPYRGTTLRLRAAPSLRRSLRGRLARWTIFRRLPELRDMHERELRNRTKRPVSVVPQPCSSAATPPPSLESLKS